MTEAKALELLALGGFGLTAHLAPASGIEAGSVLDQLLSSSRILLPPLVIRHTAPIAQQIRVPVFPSADPTIAGLEAANAAFHFIVGAREPFPVVALHQMRAQIGELLQ